jgi:hypothetical protein
MIDVVEFQSKATLGIVRLELGYVPDFVIFLSDHGDIGTNTMDLRFWANVRKYPGWPAGRSWLVDEAAGSPNADEVATGMTVWAGGEIPSNQETADGYHYVAINGSEVTRNYSGSTPPPPSPAGIELAVSVQTASARCLIVAMRADR